MKLIIISLLIIPFLSSCGKPYDDVAKTKHVKEQNVDALKVTRISDYQFLVTSKDGSVKYVELQSDWPNPFVDASNLRIVKEVDNK